MPTRITLLLESNNVLYKLLSHDEPVFTVATAVAQRGIIKEEMVKDLIHLSHAQFAHITVVRRT